MGSSTDANESYPWVEDFEQAHLSAPPAHVATRIMQDHIEDVKVLQDEDEIHHWEARCRDISSLLDSISRDIYHSFRPSLRPSGPLVFEKHCEVLRHHPHLTTEAKPDIVGTYAPVNEDQKQRLPWHRVETIVVISNNKADFTNHVEWTKRLLEARPDCPGAYGIVFDVTFIRGEHGARSRNDPVYRMFWIDAAGVVSSKSHHLHDPTNWLPLLSYVYSLYRPPKDHFLRDPSITWVEAKELGRPRWTIKCGRGKYEGCTMLHTTAEIFDRRTVIFEYRKGKNLYIIKDCFWDTSRPQEEASVLKAIHSKGVMPGIVRMKYYETVLGPNRRRILTPASKSLDLPVQERLRTVLASTGSSIIRAKSVKDLLMAIYDINEAHRCLVLKGSILHRDMSMGNLLMYPEHDGGKGKRFIEDPPKFISTVLKKKSDESKGLIIDFDNCATLLPNERRFRAVSDRYLCHGTERFMTRSTSAGALLWTATFTPMPELVGLAKDRYVEAYSQKTYDAYADGADTWHGVPKILKLEHRDCEYQHRPDHDVETTFWSLIYTLLQLRPKLAEGKEEDEFSAHTLFTWARIRGHWMNEAHGEMPQDTRDILFAYTEEDWRDALHPALASLAPLLVHMARQVHPEYGLLARSPPQEHLHEAMRRLLLAHVTAMEDPIALDCDGHRMLPWSVEQVRIDDMTGWRAHRVSDPQPEPQPELTPLPEEKPKITLRLPSAHAPSKRQWADGDGEQDSSVEHAVKSPVPVKRLKMSN